MIIQTPAIVLKSFPYGDTSIIARCFSKQQGKISLIIKGARSKKSQKGVHFQPLNHVELIYNYHSNRDLQILSKVSFLGYWTSILTDLKSITLSMAILDLTEKTLTHEDPYPNLFSTLVEVLKAFDENESNPNLLFWFYECALLKNLGFKPDLDINQFPGIVLPDIYKGKNTLPILSSLLSGDIKKLPLEPIGKKDSKIISDYLWILLKYHCESLNKVKFRSAIKAILA